MVSCRCTDTTCARYDEDAVKAEEKRQEAEEKKRDQEIKEWDDHLAGRGYKNRSVGSIQHPTCEVMLLISEQTATVIRSARRWSSRRG